jgi:hypothetical protein
VGRGLSNRASLLPEIKKLGYTGSLTHLERLLSEWRRSGRGPCLASLDPDAGKQIVAGGHACPAHSGILPMSETAGSGDFAPKALRAVKSRNHLAIWARGSDPHDALFPGCGGGAALWLRPWKSMPASSAIPHKMVFTLATFNDGDNRITGAAISHHGGTVAYSDHFGVSVRSIDAGLDRLCPRPLRSE